MGLAAATTAISFGLGLAIGYGAAYGSCAPPSIWCTTAGTMCAAFCADAWGQAALVALVGSSFAALPAGLLFSFAIFRERIVRGPSGVVRWIRVSGLSYLGILLAGLLTILVFPGLRGPSLLWATSLGAILSAAANLPWARLAGR